jgi:hypothetical protein
MPLDCRISDEHPDRGKVLQLLSAVAIPESVTITISPSIVRGSGWDLKAESPGRIMLCSVPAIVGAEGILMAIRRVLADEPTGGE